MHTLDALKVLDSMYRYLRLAESVTVSGMACANNHDGSPMVLSLSITADKCVQYAINRLVTSHVLAPLIAITVQASRIRYRLVFPHVHSRTLIHRHAHIRMHTH